MSGYDKFVARIPREVIEETACAWRYAFSCSGTWVPDIARILEHEIPRILPQFQLRIKTKSEMPNDEARTFHDACCIDFREDVYERLCDGGPRERFTGAHEMGHLFLHHGESRPRAVEKIPARTISRSQSSEGQADDFAASFLMPFDIVKGFPNPDELAQNLRVSPTAAKIRMEELRLWPKGRPPIPEVEEWLKAMKEKQHRPRR